VILDFALRVQSPTSRPITDSSNACNQASALIMCTPLHGPVKFAIHRGVALVGHMFSPKIAPSSRDRHSPRNILFLGPSPVITPNGISIGAAVLYVSQMLCCTMDCQWGRKPSKLPHLLGFCHPAAGGPSHGHRQHAKFSKDRACSSGDILAHRQTDTHTYSSQYFAIN